jgi:hypothetical protein
LFQLLVERKDAIPSNSQRLRDNLGPEIDAMEMRLRRLQLILLHPALQNDGFRPRNSCSVAIGTVRSWFAKVQGIATMTFARVVLEHVQEYSGEEYGGP